MAVWKPRRQPGRAQQLEIACMAALFATTGCIVAPPTEHTESVQTPPLLLTVQAAPPITAIVTIPERGTPAVQSFAVPVRSEDVGDRLIGVLVASYGTTDETTASRAAVLEPSTFASGARDMRVTWQYERYASGCYQLSLVVTHESNFDLVTYRPRDSAEDVAVATWWVNLGAVDTALSSCPTPPAWSPN